MKELIDEKFDNIFKCKWRKIYYHIVQSVKKIQKL